MIREWVAQLLLYALIVLYGINVGGNVYEMLVLTPLWSASPPESVRKFFEGTGMARAIQKFWLSRLAKYSLFVLVAAVIAAWNVPGRRLWLAAAVGATAVSYALTLGYIFRRKKVLFRSAVELPAEQVQLKTRQFVLADRVRLIFKFAAFLCVVQALTIPPPR